MSWSAGVFTRTNGTYSGASVWASDAAAAIKIQSSRHDTHDQDIAQGINACVAKDGSNTATLLNLSGTVNSTSGIIKVGSVVLASTYGTANSFFGGGGNFTLTGTFNCGFGTSCLAVLTSGLANCAFGSSAAAALTSGSYNTAIGEGALNDAINTTGNTAIGGLALQRVVNGSFNTGVGTSALDHVTSGTDNTAIGETSGTNITTGSYNVCIGRSTEVPSATGSAQLSIQNAIYGTGNTGTGSTVSPGNVGLYTTAPTGRLHLPAGTATAGTAPLKLTAGTVLGTPENGALEFDGTHLYITIAGVRTTIV
jgi:hypothetical protein